MYKLISRQVNGKEPQYNQKENTRKEEKKKPVLQALTKAFGFSRFWQQSSNRSKPNSQVEALDLADLSWLLESQI